MDMYSTSWLTDLDDAATKRDAALARLHEMLLKVAIHETYRRGPVFRIGRRELEDLAHPRHVTAGGAQDVMEQCLERCVVRIVSRRQHDRCGPRLVPHDEETAEMFIV